MFKLACPSYINTLPLIYGLADRGYTITFDIPSQLEKLLASGQVDAALLPVMCFLKNPELKLIKATCIASHGEVASVRLYASNAKVSLQNATSIRLDPASKTSNQLCKVILQHFYQRNLSEIDFNPQGKADLELIIGDAALVKNNTATNYFDLGALWQTHTQQPFVYACWMTNKNIPAEFIRDLATSLELGLAQLPTLAANQQIISPQIAENYLRQNIQYTLGKAEINGLETFFQLSMEADGYELRFAE